LHPHVQGGLHLFRGSFLVVFSVEFVLCLACDLSFPFFGFGHELCVVNALIKGEIEDQERPGGQWMTAPQ
jgi:hypothetical protein